MSFWLLLLLCAIGFAILASGVVLCIGLIAAPRNVTSGPLVVTARLLFVAIVMSVAVAIVAFIMGLATSWA